MSAATATVSRGEPDFVAAALEYVANGWSVVPLPPRAKAPNILKWQRLRLAGAALERAFTGAGGVGGLCGAPSRGRCDIDLDEEHARTAWPLIGPFTDLRHGRKSAPESHFWYVLNTPPEGTERLRDPDGSTLIELRSTGVQTVLPPSIHPGGEPIIWHANGEPAPIGADELRRAVRECAAVAMVARRWPAGARHDAALALAGLLLRGGTAPADAERFLEVVARVAGDDEWHDRVRTVSDTAAAIAQGDRATGGPRLAELLADGDAVVARLQDWLNLTVRPADSARALDLAEFLRVEFPPRENLMNPVFPRQGLGMVHAWRGLGKTYFAAAFGLSEAAGAQFLKWHAPRPVKVLYVDAEMRGVEMQTRIAALYKATVPRPEPSRFRIITPDLQPNGIPDLGTAAGQAWLNAVLGDSELVILDNLSSLVRSGTDKEDELWLPLLDWLLRLRASGRSALLVHHDGKNETQRGTSRREDQLDTVFHLKKPKDYKESDGARFIIHFEKHRGFYGRDAEPFEAALIEDEHGALSWGLTELEDALTIQVAEMLKAGCTVSEIQRELAIKGRATVDRHKRKAIERGLL